MNQNIGSKLREMLAVVSNSNPFYRQKLGAAGIDPTRVRSLHELPFTTKDELASDQAAHPPYGTNLIYPLNQYCRLHQTSGTKGQPLRWLDTAESWAWMLECWKVIYQTVGLRRDDRLFFPFSFGPFIGFWAAFEGAARLGNMVLPAGGMTSVGRLRFMLDNEATVVCCTPTYALRLAEVAKSEQIDLASSPVRMLIVAGEPGGSIPATRKRIEDVWGARVFDHSGMTEIGSAAIECLENPGGLHIIETEFIAEVIEGELVLTNLGRWGSPLIRYRTGDRVVIDPDPCPCGRPWLRLKGGILGRTDDMILIRGNNIYPSALENIIRRFAEIDEYRIEIDQTASLVSLKIQIESAAGTEVAGQVQAAIRDELNFRPEVTLVGPGTLPRSEMKSQRVVRKM